MHVPFEVILHEKDDERVALKEVKKVAKIGKPLPISKRKTKVLDESSLSNFEQYFVDNYEVKFQNLNDSHKKFIKI